MVRVVCFRLPLLCVRVVCVYDVLAICPYMFCGGCFWLWLEVAVSGSGLGWLFLPLVCGGCLWLSLQVVVSGSGFGWLFLALICGDCFRLGLTVTTRRVKRRVRRVESSAFSECLPLRWQAVGP